MATAILALDMATRFGWCSGVGNCLPAVGHIDLPPPVQGARGPMFHAFRIWLIWKVRMLEVLAPVTLVFEQPILPKPFLKGGRIIYPTKIETTLILQGLAAIAEEVCEGLSIPCKHVDVSTIKRELAGRGDATKADMMYVARKIGLTITCSDEADALGCWLVALRHFNPAASREFDRLVWSQRGALL